MATFRKRGDSWIAEVCVAGKRKSKSFDLKSRAKSWAIETEALMSAMADGVSPVHTLEDVFLKYMDEVSSEKKGEQWEVVRLKKFCRYDFAKTKLIDLRREHIELWMTGRLKEVKASSVNRELNLLSHCLTQARRWRLMSHNPMDDIKRPKNPPHRDRRITEQEMKEICTALCFSEKLPVIQARQRVAIAFLFAIETAMRAGEICSLRWENVNKDERTAFLPETKNGLPRYVPLSQEAIRLIELLDAKEEKVFNIKSPSLSAIFKKAVDKTNIQNLTFHDTRHEAITRLASKLDVLELARAVGHSDIKQLSTYYNKSAADIAKRL